MSNLAVTITMAVIFVAIVIWDIYLALDGQRGNTISARVREWDKKLGGIKLIISFGFGLLTGHWFW